MSKNELARIDEAQRVEVLPAPRQEMSVDDLWMIAEQACKSGLYSDSAKNPSAAFMLAIRCQAEGIHPGLAFAQFHVIEGKPALRADAMQARYQQAGGRLRWIKSDAQSCVAEFWHPTLMPNPIRITKTFAEFDRSGLTKGRDGLKKNWKQFPDAMLRARVLSAGVRAVLPAVVCGIYTPEEVADMGSGMASLGGPSDGGDPPAFGPPLVDEPEYSPPPPAAPSFKAFCEQVSARGHLGNEAICWAILSRAAERGHPLPPKDAALKVIGKAAWSVWTDDPDLAITWVEAAEHLAQTGGEAAPDDEGDFPGADDIPGDDQADPDLPDPEDAPIDPNDPRAEYLRWVRDQAKATGLEPLDILRIVVDAGAAKKVIAAVTDRNDQDLLATRGKHFWSKDPEAACKAIDLATGDEPAPSGSRSDRVASEI